MDYNLTPDGHDGFVLRPRSGADAQWDGAQQIAGTGHAHPQGNPAAVLAGAAVGAVVGHAVGSAYDRAQPATRWRIKAGLWAFVAYVGFASLFSSDVSTLGRLVGAAFGLSFGLLAVYDLLVARELHARASQSRLSRAEYDAAQEMEATEGRRLALQAALDRNQPVWITFVDDQLRVAEVPVLPTSLSGDMLGISNIWNGQDEEGPLASVIEVRPIWGSVFACCEHCSCDGLHSVQCVEADRRQYA